MANFSIIVALIAVLLAAAMVTVAGQGLHNFWFSDPGT